MLGAIWNFAKEQGSFNLLLDHGTHRAYFKTYEHQARKDSNPSTILFYFIVFCLMCKAECFTAKFMQRKK